MASKKKTKKTQKNKRKVARQSRDLEDNFDLSLLLDLIRSNPKVLYLMIQFIALLVVLILMFSNPSGITFRKKILVFDRFVDKDDEIYANLIIRPLSVPAFCNVSATYLNKTYVNQINVSEKPFQYLMHLPNMPHGNTLVEFAINCSYSK